MDSLTNLTEFYQISHLSMHYVYEAEDEKIGDWFSTYASLFPDVEGTLLFSRQEAVYTVSSNHVVFALVRFPQKNGYLFAGPTIPHEPTPELAAEMIAYAGGDMSRKLELRGYLGQLPKRDLQSTLSIVAYLCRSVLGFSPKEWRYVDYPPPIKNAASHFPEQSKPLEDDANSMQGTIFGQHIYQAICHGQIDQMKTRLGQLGSLFIETDYTASETFMHDKFVFALSQASIAAQQGGISYAVSDYLVDHYMRQLRQAKSYREIVRLFKSMLTDFTIRVHQSQLIASSDPLITRISREIENHLHEKITPTSIAEHLGYSVPYLCNQFKKNTGITITDYIHHRKITEACFLLEQPDANVTQVAMALGFTTASYFSSVFQKEMGMPPADYMRDHRK